MFTSIATVSLSGALEPTANSPDTFTLLGELALAAYDGKRAQGYAQRALQLEPKDPAALRVLARRQCAAHRSRRCAILRRHAFRISAWRRRAPCAAGSSSTILAGQHRYC